MWRMLLGNWRFSIQHRDFFRPASPERGKTGRRKSSRRVQNQIYAERLEPRCLLTVVPLVDGASEAKVLVASEADYDELGLDWTGAAEPFDHGTWTTTPAAGPKGVGYHLGAGDYLPYLGVDLHEEMHGESSTAFVRIPFVAENVAQLDILTLKMRFDDGFIAYLNGTEIARANVSSAMAYPQWSEGANASATAGASYTTFDVSEHADLLNNGTNVLAIRGFNLSITDPTFLIQAALDADSSDAPPIANDDAATMRQTHASTTIDVLANDIAGSDPIVPSSVFVQSQPSHGTTVVNPNGTITYRPTAGFFGTDSFTYSVRDNSGGAAQGGSTLSTTLVTTNAPHHYLVPTEELANDWVGGNPTFQADGWTHGFGGIGYDNDTTNYDYAPYIGDNVGSKMYQLNGSIFVRIPFHLADPDRVRSMKLRLRVEDGFVAFINGTQVASLNMPTPLPFNANATNQVQDGEAIQVREYTIDTRALPLRSGENILAFHGLNWFATSSDFLLQPELVAELAPTGRVSNHATVTVDVTPVRPTANPDTAETTGLNPVLIDVLANDSEASSPDDHPLRPESVTITQPPANGALNVDPVTGQVRYTPNPGFSGQDVFYYTVHDAAPVGGTAQATLLPRGSNWRYYVVNGLPAIDWHTTAYNDSQWQSGPAELGYGDGDEATQVGYGPDPSNRYMTTFFRSKFGVAQRDRIQSLTISAKYDDGIVMYIGNQRIGTANMPVAFNASTGALTSHEGSSFEQVATFSAGNMPWLASGENTIAVEIHQDGPGSSDISMDLEITASVLLPTGRVSNATAVTVTVHSTEAPPTAIDDQATTKHDRNVTINVLDNDLLGASLLDPSTVEIVVAPENGSVLRLSNGTVRYTPEQRFTGNDSFSYRVRDVAGRWSNPATVAVTVVNATPAPVADVYWLEQDDVLLLDAEQGVLANDLDDGLLPLTAAVVSLPEHGQLSLSSQGDIRYVPDAGYSGIDSFTYRATDEIGATADAMVTIHVRAAKVAPVAVADRYTTVAGSTLRVGEIPNQPMYIGANAVWRFRNDGMDLGTAWREPEISFSGWFSAPAPLGYGNGTERSVIHFGGDPNNRYVTTYFRRNFTVADPTLVHGLELSLLRDDGAAVYLNGVEVARSNLLPGAKFDQLAERAVVGDEESEYFRFSVPPGLLRAGSNTLAVEVHQSSPQSPDLAFDARLLGTIASPQVAGVLMNDSDADSTFLSTVLVEGPRHGVLSLGANGAFVYTPQSGFIGLDTFTYRANDGSLLSNIAAVTITVTGLENADLNGDGTVDSADLAVVASGLGTTSGGSSASGDVDQDGKVGLLDLMAVMRSYGQSTGLFGASAIVAQANRRTDARGTTNSIGANASVEPSVGYRPALRRRIAVDAQRVDSATPRITDPDAVDRSLRDADVSRLSTAARMRLVGRR